MRAWACIVVCSLVFGSICPRAPAQTFNRRYDTFGQGLNQFGWAIEAAQDSGYLLVHTSYLDVLPLRYLLTTVTRISPAGEVLHTGHSPLFMDFTTYAGWSNSSHATTDGRIVIGGSTSHVGDTVRAALIFFDQQGNFDTLYQYLPARSYWAGRQAKQTPDGGFVLCGGTIVGPSNSDAFLIKTDPQGALEWVRTHGGPGIDGAISVDLDRSGGYYLGGQYRRPGNNKELWVQRLDPAGSRLWERIWGGPYDEPNAHLTALSNGNALVASSWAYQRDFRRTKCYLAELDSTDGTILWQREYAAAVFSTLFFSVKEVTSFGDLIAAGQSNEHGHETGVLLRATNRGDSLWMRFYHYHDSVWAQGRGHFRDVLPTTDGGFIAVGTAYSYGGPDDPPLYDQDLWVVKVDAHGCLEPGCQLIGGMETQVTNLRGALRVWPNPASGHAQVAVELPGSFAAQGALRLTLVSADGRVVREQGITPSQEVQLSLQGLASGLYHLHLSDDRTWISGTKVVVE